ncbi:uncharacterized protein LOC127880588 isoform X1 [Dreissena polymorpha]|uniref:uncharacterized protein LOC127880588 isoform X1 n=1 Tax=Dreissena polymorpha TaxID=45954 RepID=UPI002263F1CC|nr:uncharacterized protein LOC127880588 isoform X1 [Dreissena polymorpha]XP_052283862.1 uncharacterized protein LOC127880588 isoform X1 [Dreissena polymorpha]
MATFSQSSLDKGSDITKSFSQSTIDKGSDMIQDFLCSTCEDKKLDKMADFYCESCVKFYCGECVNMHNKLFTKHTPCGRGAMKKWPVAKKIEDFLLKCDIHKEESLKMYCDDHSELCCTNCAFLKHRLCPQVTFISDKVKVQSTDFQKLSVSIKTILEEINKLEDNQKASIQYVQSSYDEQLYTIQETRQKINSALDTIEQKTLTEMKDILTKLQTSSKIAVDKCIRLRDELQQLRDAIQDISDKSKLELSFIATRKCMDKIQQSETYLKENSLQAKVSITFQPNHEIIQYLSKLSGLGQIEHSTQTLMGQGNPNKVITVQGKSEHNVNISSDSQKCSITAICVLPDRKVLVVDNDNANVKLLDQQYQVVSHWSATGWPVGMCEITPSEVAVTLDCRDTNTHKVQFITVNNRQLVKGKKLQFQHTCSGIAFHQGDLYITSRTALYMYTLSGIFVSKMYEDTSGDLTVDRCAVSPTGDKLYINNYNKHKLLILARDGSVLVTFTDPAMACPTGVNVTPSGQVLVCGGLYPNYYIIQLDSEGKRKLATLATEKDGICNPWSVCYNRHTACIIVGLFRNNSIQVFKAQ